MRSTTRLDERSEDGSRCGGIERAFGVPRHTEAKMLRVHRFEGSGHSLICKCRHAKKICDTMNAPIAGDVRLEPCGTNDSSKPAPWLDREDMSASWCD